MNYLLLPAYNEEQGIKSLINDLLSRRKDLEPLQVVVVDDGSTDGTTGLIEDFQSKHSQPFIHLLKHKSNQGLGCALKTGLSFLIPKLEAGDVLFTMDADDTHPVSKMPEAIRAIHQGVDLVIFSRFAEKGEMIGVSLLRRVLSLAASFFYRAAFPFVGIYEFNCGYRAYSGKLLKKAWKQYAEDIVQERGFAANAEILLKLLAFNPNIQEIPLTLRYDLKQGTSKMRVFSTIFSHFKLCFRIKSTALMKFLLFGSSSRAFLNQNSALCNCPDEKK